MQCEYCRKHIDKEEHLRGCVYHPDPAKRRIGWNLSPQIAQDDFR